MLFNVIEELCVTEVESKIREHCEMFKLSVMLNLKSSVKVPVAEYPLSGEIKVTFGFVKS